MQNHRTLMLLCKLQLCLEISVLLLSLHWAQEFVCKVQAYLANQSMRVSS